MSALRALFCGTLAGLSVMAWSSLAAPSRAATPLDPIPAGLPAADRFRLDNGLTVVLVANQGNPYLDVQLAFRAGEGVDPVGKEGVTSLLGGLLTSGIEGKDEEALAGELARLGASIATNTQSASFVVGGQIPTLADKDVRRFLELFVAVALHPTLPADVLERDKKLRLGFLESLLDDAAGLADIAASLAAFGNGPWGTAAYGNAASLAAITRDDVADVHAALFNPSHAVLVVGGAFDPATMRAWIEAHFSAAVWGAGQRAVDGALPGRKRELCATRDGRPEVCFANPLAGPPPATPSNPRTIHVVVAAGLTQIPWRMVAPNPIAETDPRWAAFELGTFVLGGDFTSRLNVLLRTKEGLTYGAYLEPSFGAPYSGVIDLSTDATPDALAKSIGLAKNELATIIKQPIPAHELEDNRAMLVNAYAFKLETVTDVVNQYLVLELSPEPYAWLAGWRAALATPDAAAIQATMGAVDPAKMSLVVVAPADLAPTIARLARGKVVTVTAADLLAKGLP